tara:strand:- start:19 stop:618 length:600 start_codon:yes stop_codon:yes gene_type:complete
LLNDYKLSKQRQFEIFGSEIDLSIESTITEDIQHTKDSILNWRDQIYRYQRELITYPQNISKQETFTTNNDNYLHKINPFLLKANSINFWRSNKPIHKGSAMYFVLDSIKEKQIILYIGETFAADKRWKGEHDCKRYVSNYKESLSHNKLVSKIDIRFFLDVPKDVKLRRKLEKKLIYMWLPPFNKETRDRWSTTFTYN